MKRLLFILLMLATPVPAHAETGQPVRFGLTAVVVKENLRFLDRWAEYLSNKIGRPVAFVQRRSYREVMDLLGAGSLDFAWICGFPYVQKRDPEFLELLTIPVYKGKPLYQSFIIVHRDSPYQTLDDLKGKVFAFSDPESNSGFLYPNALLSEKGESSEAFFRQTFFTFNHAETVQAVAEQFADAGAVDSYIWEYMVAFRPEVAKKTRVIQKSPAFGFPPLVARKGIDAEIVMKMRTTLQDMKRDENGIRFLDGLMLDGFESHPDSLFMSIREMVEKTQKAQPWLAEADKGGK